MPDLYTEAEMDSMDWPELPPEIWQDLANKMEQDFEEFMAVMVSQGACPHCHEFCGGKGNICLHLHSSTLPAILDKRRAKS